jgi:hypothetical protein
MAGNSVPCRNKALAVCTDTLTAPGNLLSMRALIMRNASDSGELSGAAVEILISVWACANGHANKVARLMAVAMNDLLMLRS